MAGKAGQIIPRGERTWLVRVFMGRDSESGKRKYVNKTIHGTLRDAQAYLSRSQRDRDLGVFFEPSRISLDRYLDKWLETAAKPKLRAKTHRDYEALLRRYVRPALGPSQHTLLRPYRGKRQQDAMARCLARSPDIVFFHGVRSAASAMSLSLDGARVLLDLGDVEHRLFAREVGQPPRWRLKPLLYLQVPALWWGERGAIVRSDRTFVCSEADRHYLRRTMAVRNVDVVPNAVPRIPDRALATNRNVLFLGAYSHQPNVLAAEYLVREVWPRLTRICPPARLLVAGPRSEEIPSFQDPPKGVEFLGFVSDLDRLYRMTRVVCCPILSGSGTRIKILEAASYGVPVVATPLAAEGIDLVPEREILLRCDPRALAQACADLIADDARASAVGTAARERVRELYARDAVVQRMAAILAGDTAVRTGAGVR